MSAQTTSKMWIRSAVKGFGLLIIVGTAIYWGNRNLVYKMENQFFVMSTFAEVTLYGTDKTILQQGGESVKAAFRQTERVCNIFTSASEISKINVGASESPMKASDYLWAVLDSSRELYRISDGAFDVTVRPLMQVWGFHRKRGHLPSDQEIETAQKHVGLNRIRFNDQEKMLFFPDSGMSLDMGAIAKGYAVDCAADSLIKLGIRKGIVNLGGNLRCLPEPPEGERAYRIGIRHPLHKTETYGTVLMLNQSVATSGNYERYVVIDGKRYTHIVNPKTGYPVADGMLAVTVIAPNAALADGYSTAVFICGETLATKICAENPAVSILIFKQSASVPDSFDVLKFGSAWETLECHTPTT